MKDGENLPPIQPDPQYVMSEGMTLLDYFAAAAMPMATEDERNAPTGPRPDRDGPTYVGAACRAYNYAAAMLSERERRMGK